MWVKKKNSTEITKFHLFQWAHSLSPTKLPLVWNDECEQWKVLSESSGRCFCYKKLKWELEIGT